MNKSNKQCRNILFGYVTFVLVIGCAVLAAGIHAINKMEDRLLQYEDPQAVVHQHVTSNHWQQKVDEVQALCGRALDEVAASMTDEEFDRMPLEVWQSAYQRCLLDNKATL